MSDRELVARAMIDRGVARCDALLLTDAVLAALSAAGRLRAEATGEVVEAVASAIAQEHGSCGQFLATQVAQIAAADAERRVRERLKAKAEATGFLAVEDIDG